MRRSLEWKLPSLIAGLVMVVVLGYCWAAYRELRASSIQTARDRLAELAREFAGTSGGGATGRLRALATQTAILRALAGDGSTDSAAKLLRRGRCRARTLPCEPRNCGLEREYVALAAGDPLSALDSIRLMEAMHDVARVPIRPAAAVSTWMASRVVSWTVVPDDAGRSDRRGPPHGATMGRQTRRALKTSSAT